MTSNQLRDALMHTNGTSPLETIAVIVPSFSYSLLATILVSLLPVNTHKSAHFAIEFGTLVVPIILNVTILADSSVQLLSVALAISVSLLIKISSSRTTVKSQGFTLRNYLNNVRSTINIISVIAILAVDFRVFPRRFAKTETYGYSLMDVGVGLFMFANGIVDSGKNNLFKSLKGLLPLLMLGLSRLLITKQIDYQVPVLEYGVHWNFFITLAICKLFVTLIFHVVDIRFIWINASLLMISHEVLLEMGFKQFVFSNVKRTDFMTSNREGLVSAVGYISLYLLSAYFGYFLNWKRDFDNTKKMGVKLVGSFLLTLVLSLTGQYCFGISRKLANLAYCFWILFIGSFMCTLFYLGGKLTANAFHTKITNCVYSPLIFQAINYNGLAFFLISNLLTGAINIVCDTLSIGPTNSLIIISCYMLVNCALICILYKKQIKLKL